MAAFVAEDEEDFVLREAVDGGVPENKALGGADAGHVGIDSVGLPAGFHQEHAAGRDVGSDAGDDGFQPGHQGGVMRF